MKIKIREIIQDDLEALLKLYEQLGPNPFVQVDEHILDVWNKILQNKDYHIIVADVDGVTRPPSTRLRRLHHHSLRQPICRLEWRPFSVVSCPGPLRRAIIYGYPS